MGPPFFLIYINNLVSVVFSSVALLFADDMKLIYSDGPEQLKRLQSEIDNLLYWSTQNCLLFNAKKCSVSEFVPEKKTREKQTLPYYWEMKSCSKKPPPKT